MNNDPLEIIDEYLGSESPQLRRNAMTALAVLKTPQAVNRLFEAALNDADASVRARAEEELLSLDEQYLPLLADAFHVRLSDKNKRLQTYALLGRLRSRGSRLSVKTLTWLQSFYFELKLFSYIYPQRGWAFYLRSCMPAFKGGVYGAIAYSAFFGFLWYSITKQMFSATLFGKLLSFGFIAPIILVPFITVRASAVVLYPNRFPGVLVELIWAGLGGLIMVLFYGIDKPGAAPILPAMIAIRMGCLLSQGVGLNYVPKHFVQTMTGIIAGTLVFMAIAFVELFQDNNFTLETDTDTYSTWLIYIAAIIPGAANSYAVIDKASDGLTQCGILPKLASYCLFLLFIVFISLAFFPEPPCKSQGENILSISNEEKTVKIEGLPICRTLTVVPGQQAYIEMDQPQQDNLIKLSVVKNSPNKEYIWPDLDKQLKKKTILPMGNYSLIFSDQNSALGFKEINNLNALRILLDHYNNLLRRGDMSIKPINVNIIFEKNLN